MAKTYNGDEREKARHETSEWEFKTLASEVVGALETATPTARRRNEAESVVLPSSHESPIEAEQAS